jgi:hypothetical protein
MSFEDGAQDSLEAPTPLTPEELRALLAQPPSQRAQWMIDDVARHETAWGLEDAQGWVVAKLAQAIPGGPAYALPLWPRQDLAALEARDSREQPKAIDLESLLEELLPEVQAGGWAVLAFSVKDAGQTYLAAEFSDLLSNAWEALAED